MMVATLEVEHQFLNKDQKLHLTLQAQIIEVEVHERALSSCAKELLVGNEAVVRILDFLGFPCSEHLTPLGTSNQISKIQGFSICLQCLWVASS